MLNAWKNYRRYSISFAEALHRAWLSAKAEEINAERIKRSKEAADVTEDTNTWVGWKKLGYEVIHGSKALFGCSLIWGSKGDGASYNASFFGRYHRLYSGRKDRQSIEEPLKTFDFSVYRNCLEVGKISK